MTPGQLAGVSGDTSALSLPMASATDRITLALQAISPRNIGVIQTGGYALWHCGKSPASGTVIGF
jgi:hypothetical protein